MNFDIASRRTLTVADVFIGALDSPASICFASSQALFQSSSLCLIRVAQNSKPLYAIEIK
jgi:hypothetical protein